MIASRVRKARKPGICALCHAPVTTGQQIGYTTTRGWCHATCIIQACTPCPVYTIPAPSTAPAANYP